MVATKKAQVFFYKIMLVDGNTDAQILFREAVSDLNCRLAVYNSGSAAVFHLKRLQRREHPHLIVWDGEMEGMNGLEVLMRLKLADALYHIPVIFYSDQMNDRLAAKLKGYGAAQCFHKTAEMKEMKEYLKVLQIVFRNGIIENVASPY